MKIPKACTELNRSQSTIKRWIETGYVNAIKIGRDWDISEAEIARLKGKKPRGRKKKVTL
jgi:predicted site-specific integrase-resolvase